MKRGKDDDKNMGPMFPRLHVNDAGKGGPRAPPRNKMALYEQLTIPSQRYNSGALPLTHNGNNLVPTSTSQGSVRERNMYFPLYRSLSSNDDTQVRLPEALNLNNQRAHVENKKQPFEEDEFMVPIFPQLGVKLCNANIQNSVDGEGCTHLSSNHLIAFPSTGDKETNHGDSEGLILEQQMKNQGRNVGVSDAPRRLSLDMSIGEKDDSPRRTYASAQREHQDKDKHRLSSLEKTGASLREDDEDNSPVVDDAGYDGGVSDQPLENLQKAVSLKLSHNPRVLCGYKGDNKTGNGMRRIEDYQSNIRDNVCKTSVVDSVTGLDISPDDVVGLIGRQQFWNARTAIVNQQRVFAVQVFELHRLIKVQKLIAESPDLLLEDGAFVGKASLKGSIVKKYSPEYAVKALAHKNSRKDDYHKAIDKVEGVAENVVAKTPIPPQNAIQPMAQRPFSSSNVSSSPPVNVDPKMNPWGFHQLGAHQWLVPVMSPSEGLVYKPYPGPGFMGPVCGGCGPGGLMNSAYAIPAPPYQQGMGVPPGMHFGGHDYFPPYGMPIMSPSVSGSTVEQLNHFSGPNPYGQLGQCAGPSINVSMQHQSSLNLPSQKNGTVAPAVRSLPHKDGELQGSTASSPSERAQGMGMAPPTEGRDALLFPPVETDETCKDGAPAKLTRVIKVVPHKPGLTKESAARIFQSIQEERRQYEFS